MRKPKLVPNWKRCWKWLSMQGMILAATVQTSWLALPEDWKTSVPSWLVATITITCLVLGTVGRLIQQEPQDTTPESESKGE